MALRLTDVRAVNAGAQQSRLPNSQIVVHLWGMRNQVLTRAATWPVGQTVTLRITPWQAVEDQYGSYNRIELEDDNTSRLATYWGEEEK